MIAFIKKMAIISILAFGLFFVNFSQAADENISINFSVPDGGSPGGGGGAPPPANSPPIISNVASSTNFTTAIE